MASMNLNLDLDLDLDLSPASATHHPGVDACERFLAHPIIWRYIARYVEHRVGSARHKGWHGFSMSDRDDILQEIRVSIWRNWNTAFVGRDLNGQMAYAMNVARSRVIDRYRQRTSQREVSISDSSATLDEQHASESGPSSINEGDLFTVILARISVSSSLRDVAPGLAQSATTSSQNPEELLVERDEARELLARILSVCKTPRHRLILLCHFAGRDLGATLATLDAAGCPSTERGVSSIRSRLMIQVRALLASERASDVARRRAG